MAELSEPARYAYAALFALSLNQRICASSCDIEFSRQSIRRLLEHLKLMRCETAMLMLMENDSEHSIEPYLEILSEEPNFDGSILIFDALRWTVQQGRYDARIRVVLHDWAIRVFRLTCEHFDMLEDAVVTDVIEAIDGNKSQEEQELQRRRTSRRQVKKYAFIGAASVGGGVLLGLTGGIVAPLVGASIAALLGIGGTAAAGTVAGAAILGSLFGATGAGVAGYKMKKRVGDVEEFSFVPLPAGEGSRLHVTIAVPGWLPPADDDPDDEDRARERLMRPWQGLVHSSEQYGLQFETKYLAELGEAITMLYTMAVSMAANQMLKMTVLHSLMAAVALPRTVLGMTAVIDNPWCVCCNRSAEAGEMLAVALMDGAFGRRPVTLCGFSLGARVIFFCLKALEQRGEPGRGVIQDAILIGSPVTGSANEWRPLLDVVAGRLVNAYSRNDWVLKVVYRTSAAAYDIAGLQPIDLQHDRMLNVDLTELISGHGDYRNKVIDCIRATGVVRVDEESVRQQCHATSEHQPTGDRDCREEEIAAGNGDARCQPTMTDDDDHSLMDVASE